MGPGSASGAGPLPNLPPSSTPSQLNTYPHCPPVRVNSPSPARSITPQPHQTPPALPGSQTPQPQTPGTPQLPPPQQPQQQDSQQQQQLGKAVNSEKAGQLSQPQGGVASTGPQAAQASLVPTQNAHVPMQLPQTPVSKSTFFFFFYYMHTPTLSFVDPHARFRDTFASCFSSSLRKYCMFWKSLH